MAYDENVRIISEEVERLKNQIHNLDVEIPEHPSTDAGKILSVDSDGELEWRNETSYTPPSYSTEEVNTGQKWINGKDIYSRTFTGNFPIVTQLAAVTITPNLTGYKLLHVFGYALTASGSMLPCNSYIGGSPTISLNVFLQSNGYLVANVTQGLSECEYFITIYYTKPDPVPSTETKSKKKGAN